MENTPSKSLIEPQRAPGLRPFPILKRHDEPRLRTFFLFILFR